GASGRSVVPDIWARAMGGGPVRCWTGSARSVGQECSTWMSPRSGLDMSTNPYASFCQDFYINMRINTQLTLPHNRETVLHFFERVQKEFPAMTQFRRYDNGDFNLEEDRKNGSYRWVRLESKRLVSGFVNPANL